ncbi:MAG: phosphoglycerate dehydrogenase [Xanthomonadaceae bacterium]|nr:phosphoglycerate dehydrogenase [Xanthomonadaceae bacterium]
MFSVLTLNNIARTGLDRFPRDRYLVGPDIPEPDAVMLRSADLHGRVLPDSVKAVGRAGSGVNNIPVAELTARGIPVFNAPGANANAVKELVLAGMLIAARNLAEAWSFARGLEGDAEAVNQLAEQGKKQFAGFELPRRTLGVVGLGAIGVEVCNAAQALGMKVIGFDPQLTVQRAWQLSASVQQALSLDDLVANSDFVTFHVPLNEHTRGLLNEARVRLLRTGAVVLNLARSGIVDDDALLEVLDAGRVHAYVTDFPSPRFAAHPRVIAFPHLGASTAEAEENCAVQVADTLRDFLEQGNIRYSVNFPEAVLPPVPGGARVVIANRNVPNMVGQITTAVAKRDHNIIDMLNRSRGDHAWTVLDLEGLVSAETLAMIRDIDGVLSARVIGNEAS